MQVNMLELECWIFGDDVDRTFRVEIPRNKVVSDLKEVIKNKRPVAFNAVDAVSLDLYTIPSSDDLEDELRLWNPRQKTKLNNRKKLSDVFSSPAEVVIVYLPDSCTTGRAVTHDHTITSPVGRNLNIRCLVLSEGPGRPFKVQVAESADVDDLKELIKQKRANIFHNLDAAELDLYLAPLNTAEERDLILVPENLLNPMDQLSDVFTSLPPKGIHVLVSRAPSGVRTTMVTEEADILPPLPVLTIEARRLTFLKDRRSEPPSFAGKPSAIIKRQGASSQTIYCNRPHNAWATIPPTLLHQAFGEFVDDCETLRTTADDNTLAAELHVAMADHYANESVRAQVISTILSGWGLHFNATKIGEYTTDGDMSVGFHRYVIAEFKNEVGSAGAEPYHQAALYYLEATRGHAAQLAGSCLPCLFILLFGPFITFVGATWNTRPVIEPLAITLHMHYHPFNTKMRERVARQLAAFRKAVPKLKQYYEGLQSQSLPKPSPEQAQLFPYPTDFISLRDGRKRRFAYLSQPFEDRLIFFGVTLDDKTSICIKFVNEYSKDVHLECASLGHAPELHGFDALPGGWFMVVMDRLVEKQYIQFREQPPSAPLMDNIRDTLRELHKRNYVHGDVRDTNIMVSKIDESNFMFVDFDWAGKIDQARYPMNVARGPNLWRPDGAVDGELIRPEHDMDMLDEMRKRYRIPG